MWILLKDNFVTNSEKNDREVFIVRTISNQNIWMREFEVSVARILVCNVTKNSSSMTKTLFASLRYP